LARKEKEPLSVKQVVIKFMGPLKRPKGIGATARLSVSPEGTLEDVLREIGYDSEERSRLRVVVDGEIRSLSSQIGEALELTVFLPLGGG
jgi:hypothetical protein